MSETTAVRFPAGRTVRILNHRVGANASSPANFEREYLEVLAETLKPGMVVFDVGAEQGEFSAFAAGIVSGENVHLFEPSQTVWANIKAVWKANDLAGPGGCWPGFVADEPSVRREDAVGPGWPSVADGPLQLDGRFAWIAECPDLPSTTIDRYVERRGVAPSVVMIDVEGAEVLVFRGMRKTLTDHRPIVFASIHPADFLAHLDTKEAELFNIAADAGYRASFISSDHEKHMVFYPPERA